MSWAASRTPRRSGRDRTTATTKETTRQPSIAGRLGGVIVNIAQTIPLADTWMHGGWGWGWMSLMMIVMVLFWGAVIFGIFCLIRFATRDSSSPGEPFVSRESPVD